MVPYLDIKHINGIKPKCLALREPIDWEDGILGITVFKQLTEMILVSLENRESDIPEATGVEIEEGGAIYQCQMVPKGRVS